MRYFIPIVVLAISAVAVADHREFLDPSDGPQAAAAVNAKQTYQMQVQSARADYEAKMTTARQQLIASLTQCEANARAAGQLAEADRIDLELHSAMTSGQAARLDHDDDELGILSANWGIDNRWVDVTDNVRHHVRDSRLEFDRLQYGDFPDPARDVLKDLVLEVRPSPRPLRIIIHQLPHATSPDPVMITERH